MRKGGGGLRVENKHSEVTCGWLLPKRSVHDSGKDARSPTGSPRQFSASCDRGGFSRSAPTGRTDRQSLCSRRLAPAVAQALAPAASAQASHAQSKMALSL